MLKNYLKLSLIALGLLFAISNTVTFSLTTDQAISTENHLETTGSATDSIINGDFESGTTAGWGLKYLKAGETNQYEVSIIDPYGGAYSYYMYAVASNPTYPRCVIEIGQNITVNEISKFNLTGNVKVYQCTSNAPSSSWAGIYVVFYNSAQDELGRIYYRFAENQEWEAHEYEIELYNQLYSWLEFNRNIAQDFVNEIGGDSGEVTQIELVFKVLASDEDQSGGWGYCEAFFDDWSLEYQQVNTIANGGFESGTSFGWGLKNFKEGEETRYGVLVDNPYSGSFYYSMDVSALNPTYRRGVIEIGQNITVDLITGFNLTGNVKVYECTCNAPFSSWAGIYVIFYNRIQDELGRIYYRFAENREWEAHEYEIELYNQLDSWLEFNRNIAQDFVNEIGGDSSEVTQIELVFKVLASDGESSGDRGRCWASFDNWRLERQPSIINIKNGGFESGTTAGWGLKYLNLVGRGSFDQFGVSTTNPHGGSYSYHMCANAYDPHYGESVIEISQNITVNEINKINLKGNVYVSQCTSNAPSSSWAGIYVVFYNSAQDELGRIYYRFAENQEWVDHEHEIELYNQLNSWLKFDRNITQDFVYLIGGDSNEVTQIELVFKVLANDSGYLGVCEAFFDDWRLNPNPTVQIDNIFIDSNADFINLGFPGYGVPEDPYLIENYTITSSETNMIEIYNTTASFRIENNLINGLESKNNGIYLYNVTHGIIVNNTIHNCLWGVIIDHYSLYNTITSNSIFNSAYNAISIQAASDLNNIAHNTVEDSGSSGIRLESAFTNMLLNNTISNSGYDGIELLSSNYNDIFNNTILNSARYGISLIYGSDCNLIKWNDFINNNRHKSQALDDVSLSDTTFNYNYWGEWTRPDTEPNGIVDNPYLIDGDANNKDPYPLTSPNNPIVNHFLSSNPIVLYPNGGETLSGTIEIEWSATSDTWGHLITYTVYYSADGGTTWNELDSGLTATSYDWDTTTLANGTNYLVKVNATCSEYLWKVDISDDKFSIDNPESTTMTSSTTPEPGVTPGWTFSILLLSVCTVLVLKRVVRQKYR
ncbi:MAG: right-handed parallel beta-helix repeat-containing protein [Promethearchaeota archaeon]